MQIIRIALDTDIAPDELTDFAACVVRFREDALHHLDEAKASSAPNSSGVRIELPQKKPTGFKKTLQNFFSGGGASKRDKGLLPPSGINNTLSPNYMPGTFARGGSLPRGTFAPRLATDSALESMRSYNRFEVLFARSLCARVHVNYNNSLLYEHSLKIRIFR